MIPTPVFIGLGSNQGDRAFYLNAAVEGLKAYLTNIKVSSFWETQAMYKLDQPPFLNAVLSGFAVLSPRGLLGVCQDLENQAGRMRDVPYGPRTLDLDILFYGQMILSDPDLVIPHPLFHEREFAKGPLAELDPNWIDPRYDRPPAMSSRRVFSLANEEL